MSDSNVKYVETYKDVEGEWRWRAIAGNGEVVSTGESHGSRSDARRAVRGVFGADIVIDPKDSDSMSAPSA